MKRPVLGICVDCGTRDDDALGKTLFKAVKKERRKRELKSVFKVEPLRCLDRCDIPCNAQLRGKHKPTLELTELDARRDAVPLLDAMVRYAQTEGESFNPALGLPGKPA
jgi:predicted metal-binding protein